MSSFYQYWKHSKEQRLHFLSKYKKENLDIIPYWHADWHVRPTNFELRIHAPIMDLINWAKVKGRVLSFYIPLTPCPIVPEGGLPYNSKVNSLDHRRMSLSIVDRNGELNHLHSAFGKKTPELFYSWLEELKNLCKTEEVGIHWWGLRCHYPDNISFHSYLEDSSSAFEKSFTGYVKQNQLEDEDNLVLQKDRFQKMVGEFYKASMDDILENENYKLKDLCFLKGNPESIFWTQASSEQDFSDISLDFCRAHTYDMRPDFSLIKRERFPSQMWDFFERVAPANTDYREVYMQNSRVQFSALSIFRLWGDGSHAMIEEKANELKLTTFFFNFFRWKYVIDSTIEFNEEALEKITFCFQERLKNSQVKKMAKAFSQGHKLIFFQESFSEKQWRFWNGFIESNDYFKEEMLYQGKIHYFSNSQGGQVVILSRLALAKLGINPAVELWEKIIEFFKVDAFKINHSDGVNYFWQSRDVRSHELNYKEVRRVLIHNMSKSSQRVHIDKIKNGSLTKISERVGAKVSTDDNHIWIELEGLGMTSLEFGIIE